MRAQLKTQFLQQVTRPSAAQTRKGEASYVVALHVVSTDVRNGRYHAELKAADQRRADGQRECRKRTAEPEADTQRARRCDLPADERIGRPARGSIVQGKRIWEVISDA